MKLLLSVLFFCGKFWNFGSMCPAEIDWFSFIYRAILPLGFSFLEFFRCPIEIVDKCEISRQTFGNWMGI